MPPAARISDMHTCPMVNPGPVPHVGGPDISGSPDVIVGFMPQARVGDSLVCVPAVDSIQRGSPTVLVNGRQAARIGDPTAHGGIIVAGCPTVIIGESGQGATLRGASADGTPFCEECEKAKKALEQKEQVPPPNAPPPGSADIISTEGKGILSQIREAADKLLPQEKEDRERLIRAIKPVAQKLLDGGKDEMTVAKWAKLARVSVMEAYDVKDHWDVASRVFERNKDKFGDKLGPKVEWLLSEKGMRAREIIDAAAAGNLKEKLTELKPEIIDRVASKLIENEQVRGLVVAAASGNLKEKLGEMKGMLIEKAAGEIIENEQLRSVAVAAAQGKLPEKLSEMSQGALDQVLEGLMDEKTREFAKPLIDNLKEQLGEKVTSMVGSF